MFWHSASCVQLLRELGIVYFYQYIEKLNFKKKKKLRKKEKKKDGLGGTLVQFWQLKVKFRGSLAPVSGIIELSNVCLSDVSHVTAPQLHVMDCTTSQRLSSQIWVCLSWEIHAGAGMDPAKGLHGSWCCLWSLKHNSSSVSFRDLSSLVLIFLFQMKRKNKTITEKLTLLCCPMGNSFVVQICC